VKAFVRISDEEINLREQVYSPDIVIVLDSTLIKVVNVTEGLKDKGTVILNSKNSPQEASKLVSADKIVTVDATKIALEELGVAITNTSIIGAFAKVTGLVGIDSVVEAIKERFPGSIGEKNVKAARRASKEVKVLS
jgi:2-oxoacid:acceptor oxidoreductase gamma subunit (pyruvate/2-ketoisovalerate family)